MQQVYTIGQILKHIEKNYNNSKALVSFEDGSWKALSTTEFILQVKYAAFGLLKLGIKKGDKVGIIAIPTSEWTIVDYAIMAAGAISVPLFANISEENFNFEIMQTGIKAVFIGGDEQWQRSEKDAKLFEYMIGLDHHNPQANEISYQQFLEMGCKYLQTLPEDAYYAMLDSIRPDDIATIIYTSGTTGVPKGAMHTHHSLTSLIYTPLFNWNAQKDSYLSFLPLAHVFARMLNFIMTTWGISAYYFNDVKNLSLACQEIHPTVMVVVPRLLEKMYAKMLVKIESGNLIKKWIGNFAFALANQENSSFLKKLFFPLMDRLVFRSLRNALGGELRVVFSGGAALNPHLYHFFLETGFPIYEGWGLTEACPICVNSPGKIKVGTVGLPIFGMTVKLGPDDELLVKGEMLMSGYYNNTEETCTQFDENGWLKTGDKGSIDAQGYVTIIGRVKEMFKSSTGEWIAPLPIEQELSKEKFIDTAIVIAENKKFASCLIVPEFETLRIMKQKQNMEDLDDQAFLESPFMKQEMKRVLLQVNKLIDKWAHIQDYRFIPHSLSIEEGELTPTMKIKRNVVESKYKDLIDSMYYL